MYLRIAAALLFVSVAVPVHADIADAQWIFDSTSLQGWSPRKYTAYDVGGGYFYGATAASDSSLLGPDLGVTCHASSTHYLQIKMRMRLASGDTDRFGASDAYLYFTTVSDPNFGPNKAVAFKTYGSAAWKVYNIRVGDLATWTGYIKQLKIYLTSTTGARTEVAWIKVMRDLTPPVFCAENMWTYADGQSANDTTPTISLRQPYDEVSGIDRAEFYLRAGASTSESDWVLKGTDSDGADGYQFTYPELANGVYDLGVKLYDGAGNCARWSDGDDRWIDDLHVDSSLPTRIDVDAAAVTGPVTKELYGSNVLWYQWSSKYNVATGRLTDALENSIQTMGLKVLRYATGDTFYWKLSIGPQELRPSQYDLDPSKMKGPAIFGLDEALRWCEERGIQPLLTCRFRWPGATPAPLYDEPDPYPQALQDAIDLVEYCNSPNDGSNPNGGTDWAAERAANGHPEPYNVKFFEIGNEPWGFDPYGSPGNYGFDGPSEYSVAFLNYLEGMKAVDPTIKVSATSHQQCQLDFDPANPDWAWSVYQQTGSYIDYAQIHPYLPYSAWQTDPVKLYDETMATPKALDDVFCNHRTSIRLAAPEKADVIKLRLTEWNINYNWIYDPSQGRINTYHTKTLKAAIALADALRVFMENRDFIESAEWWHLYNGTWACIAGNDTTVYPAFHTFRIYNHHFGDNTVACSVIGSPTFDYIQTSGSILTSQLDLAYLTAIASKSEDGKSLYLIVINKDRLNPHTSSVNLANFVSAPYSGVDAAVWELNGPDVDDYTNVGSVGITETTAAYGPSFNYTFPAHSVTSFKFTVTPLSVDTVADLKAIADGTSVSIPDRAVTAVFSPDKLYIEEDDRSSGLKIQAAAASVAVGDRVSVIGTLRTGDDGERYIEADALTSLN